MQQLLARMDAWEKETSSNQDKAEAEAKANHKEMLSEIDAETETMRDKRMETNMERDREETQWNDGRKAKGPKRRNQIWPSRNEIHTCIQV
jgi:hypothetical protein